MRALRLPLLAGLICIGVQAGAQQGGFVVGTVTDFDGRPLAGATVSVADGPTTTTDDLGRYRLVVRDLGEHEVGAIHTEGQQSFWCVLVSSGRASRVDFALGTHSDVVMECWEPPLLPRSPFASVFYDGLRVPILGLRR